jgi:hypothetical protein
VGNWVVGEKFWGRERECQLLCELLDDGAHVLIVAPRRVGKTSLMRETARRLGDRYDCLFVDLEKSERAADAVVELALATRPHQSLWSRTVEVFRSTLANIEQLKSDELTIKLHDGLLGDWRAKGERLFEEVAKSNKPVAVFLDELAVLVSRLLGVRDDEIRRERIESADAFMSFIRAQCVKHRERIRFVVAGSIGLLPLLRRVGLSGTLNAFTPFELGAWEPEAAIGCIEALAAGHGVELDTGVPQRMVNLLVECVPHHVQVFFNELYVDCVYRGKKRCSVEDVQRVFDERMLSSRGHAELCHLEERLKLALSKEELPLAIDLLSEAAVKGHLSEQAADVHCRYHFPSRRHGGSKKTKAGGRAGHKASERLRRLLDVLEHDGYLVRDGDDHVFASRLVKSWWKARFGRGFTTAAERSKRP